MRKWIKDYVSVFEKELNVPLMNKSSDRPLVDYVKDAWKSLEIVKNIDILGFDYMEKESDVNINKFIYKREKKKKKKDRCDYKFVHDDRYGCLTTYIRITVEELDEKTKETVVKQKLIKKQMLVPLQDEETGKFFIKGKSYIVIYQLTDKSTYTSSSSVTLKSLDLGMGLVKPLELLEAA